MLQHFETRKLLILELTRVCPVRSLIRFGECNIMANIIILYYLFFIHSDGCNVNINGQTDLDIGESIEVPCPCHEYLQTLPGVKDQKARRICGGTYKNGAQLLDIDLSQCSTIVSGATYSLCFAAMVCILHKHGLVTVYMSLISLPLGGS